MDTSPRRVSTIVLTGAGFSVAAGLPLTKDLVHRGREQSKIKFGDRFLNALDETAQRILNGPIGDDIEAALTRLKVVELYSEEYSTKVRGSAEERNYTTKLLQFELAIYNVMWATLNLPSDPPPLYDDFLRSLGDDVAFASLNYDMLLETLFRRNRRAWHYPLQD